MEKVGEPWTMDAAARGKLFKICSHTATWLGGGEQEGQRRACRQAHCHAISSQGQDARGDGCGQRLERRSVKRKQGRLRATSGWILVMASLSLLRGPSCAAAPMLSSTALVFLPAQVDVPVETVLTFTTNESVAVGDVVNLVLPGLGEGIADFHPTLYSFSGYRRGSWTLSSRTLSMTATHESPAGLIEIKVPGDQGIHLPAVGVREGTTLFTIAANTSTGAVAAAPVSTVPPIGAFASGPALSYKPHRTQVSVAISIEFSAYMDLVFQDHVFLKLPGFQAGGIASVHVTGNVTTPYTNGGAAAASCAEIVGCTGSGFAGTCIADGVASIAVTSSGSGYSAGAALVNCTTPCTGSGLAGTCAVDGNGAVTGITITNAGSGYSASNPPTVACPDGNSDAVVAPTLGAVTAIIVTFEGSGYLPASLPIVQCAGGTGLVSAPNLTSRPNLILTAEQGINESEACVLRIAQSNGLMLPADGLTHNQSSLLIGSYATAGPSAGQPIANSPAVVRLECVSSLFHRIRSIGSGPAIYIVPFGARE